MPDPVKIFYLALRDLQFISLLFLKKKKKHKKVYRYNKITTLICLKKKVKLSNNLGA